MTDFSPSPTDDRASWLAREAIYDRFEMAWQEGTGPALENFLPATDSRTDGRS